MNKSDIIKIISEKNAQSKIICAKIVNSFIDVIRETLNKGERININKFGVWSVKEFKDKKQYLPNVKTYKIIRNNFRLKFKVSPNFKIGFLSDL